MQSPPNPFTTLYVTERMEEDKFPPLFSPVLVPQALSLFQAGNVVVRGTQGTGKSMLLALLRTDIRAAFEGHKDIEYPVDAALRQFVSAEINLATNQALRIANRWGESATQTELADLQCSFVDYVNTWLLRDLLTSIRSLQTKHPGIWNRYRLGGTQPSLDKAVQCLGHNKIVGQILEHPGTFADAHTQLTDRIETYLRFLNGKTRALPSALRG